MKCNFDLDSQSDCKLGALLSGLTGFVCWGLSKFDRFNYKDEDVVEQAHAQVEEELAEMIDYFKASHRCLVPTQAPAGEDDASGSATPPVSSADSSSTASDDDGGVQLAARPQKIVAREQARRGSTQI